MTIQQKVGNKDMEPEGIDAFASAARPAARPLRAAAVAALMATVALPAAAQTAEELRQQYQLLSRQMLDMQRQMGDMKTQMEAAAKKPPVAPSVARSGKDAVTLTVSGQVNRAGLFADDGKRSESFFVDNAASSTRVNFTGEARLSPDFSAGAQIEVETQTNSSKEVAIGLEDPSGDFLRERKMEIWFDSKTAGRVWLGQGDTASNTTAEVDLSGTTMSGGWSDVGSMAGAMQFRNTATGALGGTSLEIKDVFDHFDGFSRQDRVRYDTPSLDGFKLSGSVISSDRYDVGLYYTGKTGDIQLAAAVGYGNASAGTDFNQYSGSVSALHSSGVNLTAAAGAKDVNGSAPTGQFLYGKLGYLWSATTIGKTAVAVDIFHAEDKIVSGDDGDSYGAYLVQNIDRLASEIYAGVRVHAYDQPAANFDDIVAGWLGARIKF